MKWGSHIYRLESQYECKFRTRGVVPGMSNHQCKNTLLKIRQADLLSFPLCACCLSTVLSLLFALHTYLNHPGHAL